MNSRVVPPTSRVSRPTKRPMPCSSWTTRSSTLRSRKSERKLRSPPPPAPRVEVDLLREDVAVGEDDERGPGQLEPARQRPHPGQDPRPGPHREAVLAQHVGEAVRPAGVAEEHDRGPLARAEVRGQAPQVAGVARGRAAGEVTALGGGVDLPHLDHRRLPQPREEGLGGHQHLLGGAGARPSARRCWSSWARDQNASASSRTASGSRTAIGPGAGRPTGGRSRRGRGERDRRGPPGRGLGRGTRGRLFASRRSPKRSASRRSSAARMERVANTSERGRRTRDVEGPHRSLRLGVESAQALDGVAQELDADRLVVVRREDVEDAAASRHLPRRRDRVLARVAALVEGLEEDLGGHLVARAQA